MASNYKTSTDSSQLSSSDKNKSTNEQIRNLVTDLNSQELFENTPVRNKQKLRDNRKLKKINKNNRENIIFNPEAEGSTDSIAQGNNDDTIEESIEIEQVTIQSGQCPPEPTNDDMTDFLKLYINNNTGSSHLKRTEKAKKELREAFLQQTRKRDRAQRNLENIRSAIEKTGRVPNGMQIKVIPEVPDNGQIIFKHEWAVALTEAEGLLSDCIEKHLERVIETTDNNISTKARLTREILNEEGEDDGLWVRLNRS